MTIVVATIYAADPPKNGYLDKWGVPAEKQEALLQNGAWLVVDTANNTVTVGGKDYGDCPQWCICKPKGSCLDIGDECLTCAMPPSPGVKLSKFINDIVDTLIARNKIVVSPKKESQK